VLIIDNFELIYVIAAWLCRFLYGNKILLDFEDGKHLTDHGWSRCLSAPAEFFGKPLIQGAILAHPSLGERLSPKIPKILVPGFYNPLRQKSRAPSPGTNTHFLYAGSLDSPRGIDLLLKTIPLLPDSGWRLDIAGSGPLESKVLQLLENSTFAKKVLFHSALDSQACSQLMDEADIGLNLQISGNPISQVTFPSKLFSYLSSGLLVISSKASEVEAILGKACLYLSQETPEALADLMTRQIPLEPSQTHFADLEQFSIPSTALRLRAFLNESVPAFL
jgi:glycosyltransferase involved in cell wall biosynthesis